MFQSPPSPQRPPGTTALTALGPLGPPGPRRPQGRGAVPWPKWVGSWGELAWQSSLWPISSLIFGVMNGIYLDLMGFNGISWKLDGKSMQDIMRYESMEY